MTELQQWAMVICGAVLVSALLQYLIPDGSMEKMGKMIVSAFILCSLLVPIGKVLPALMSDFQISFSQNQQGSPEYLDTVDQQIYQEVNNGIRTLVIGKLAEKEIACKNVTVFMDTNEDDSISINKVKVVLPSGETGRCEEAAGYLEQILGLPTEVTIDGTS